MEKLSAEEVKSVDSLLNEIYGVLKNPTTNTVSVKELKAIFYYSELHTKNPLAYKAISDLEQDPTTILTLPEFKKVVMGGDLAVHQPPSIEQLCMVDLFVLLLDLIGI